MPDRIRPEETSKKSSSQDYRLEEISSSNVCMYLGLSEEELEQSTIISKSFAENLPQASTPVEQQMARRNVDEHCEALRLLDKLQIEGRYEEFVAHLASVFAEHSNTQSRADLIEKNDRFWRVENAFRNFRAGMESSEPDQRARFHSFWEGIVAKVYLGSAPMNGYHRAVHEHLELFEALERGPAPQRPVERRGPVDDSLALQEMKRLVLLENQTVRSAAFAAVDRAAGTGGTRESVAKRLERAYNAKRKLREN